MRVYLGLVPALLLLACDDAGTTGLAAADAGHTSADDGAPAASDGDDASATARDGSDPDATTAARDASDLDAGPLADEPLHRAGTRLRPQWVTSADGRLRRFRQIWDDRLDGPCFLTRFADADTDVLCHPRATGITVFLDAACTTPFVETIHERGWVAATAVVRLGPRVTPTPAQRYIAGVAGRCLPFDQPPTGVVYAIAETAPADLLARGRVVDDDGRDPGLRTRVFAGDDGSRFLYELSDATADVGCTPALTADGARCRPDVGELHDEGLLDATCARLTILDYVRTPVAAIPERNGDVYRFTFPGFFGLHDFGRRDDASGMCRVEQRSVGRYTVHEGVPYPAAEWPAMQVEDAGDRALSAEIGRLAGGGRAEPEPRVDVRRLFAAGGEPCGPTRTASGIRCLPTPPANVRSWVDAYADTRCSEPALAVDPGTPPPAQITVVAAGGDPLAPPLGVVYAVGERLDPARVFTGACTRVGDAGLPASDYYRLGDQRPPTDFPALVLTP